MSNNPFGNHMPGAQPGQPQQGYAQPGYPAAPAQPTGYGPPQQPPQQQGWGPPQGAPPQQPPQQQGWGPPQGAPPQQPPQQQGWGPPQGAPPQQPPQQQGWGPPQGAPPQQPPQQQGWGPPAQPGYPPQGNGYGPQNGAPQGFTQNMPTALPPGVSESGDSTPIILKPGSFVLEYEKHALSTQSATLFFYFKILESDVPEYAAGMTVKWIKKFSEAPGHWKWNKDAGWVLGLIRPLMGYRDAASFQAVQGWESFVISIIRGEPQPALMGKRLRDVVSYQYKDGQVKIDRQRGQPFMAHDWRVL